MGRVETVDASGLVNPGKRQELEKAMKEAQFALRWTGRSSPGRNDVEVIDSRLPSPKADNGHRPRNPNPSVKTKEIASVRTKALQFSSPGPLPETGRTGNPVKGEDNAFELFKKDFIEKLAEKAKERPGYLLANEDFAKPVKAQPKLFRGIDEDLGKSVKAEPKLFKHTESWEHPSSFAGLPNSKKEILERTKKIIESSRALLRASSLEQRKSTSPVHQKFSDPSWMTKCEKLKLVQDKQSWSKDVEDTSKEFILNKFFQTPTKRTPSNSLYDAYNTDEDATPKVYSSTRRILSTENNAAQKPKSVRQQNLGQMTVQSEKCREAQDFDSGKMLGDYGAQIRSDVSKPSTGSPGRSPSSEDTRKDSCRSPGRKLSSEEKRNDSSGSPGRRLSSEQRRKDSTTSPGRRLSSEERKKDSFQIPTRSIGGVFAAGDLRTRVQGTQSNSGRTRNESSAGESQQGSVKREKEGMVKTLKMAAAVDQDHFLRALQDNGAVQSSESSSNDMETVSGVNDAALQRSSSSNGRKISNNLRETKRDFPIEVREPRSREPSPTARREVAFGSSIRSREPSPTARREVAFGSTIRSREPSPTARREVAFGSTIRSREPSPTPRREVAFGSSIRSREASSAGRRDAASFVSSTRSREPSLNSREATSYGSSGSTNAGRTASMRRSHSLDSSFEKGSSSLRSGDIRRKSSGEGSPSRANSPSGRSPQLSRQSSLRSSETDENESVSGGSIIEKLMKKASLRNSSRLAENQTISSSVPGSPNRRLFQPPSSDSKSFADVNEDTGEARCESTSQQTSRASSPTSCRISRKTSIESNLPEVLPRSLSERKSSRTRVAPVSQQSAPARVQQHPLNNSLRVNVQVKESTIAKLKSRSLTSPTVKTIEESCRPIATPERKSSTVTSGGSPWSPGSDDSSSEGSGCSGIEQPSPVSVLSYNSRRTPFQDESRLSPLEHKLPFQEESRLSPLEHKLQVLHDRIRKSKTDVSNQKKARLEKIKATEAQLNGCVVAELNTEELLRAESKTPKTPKTPNAPQALQLLLLPAESDVEEKKPLAPHAQKASRLLLLPAACNVEEKKSLVPKASQLLLLPAPSDAVEKRPLSRVIPVVRDEKLEKARPAAPILDFCTSLETLDLKSILPWADKKWDLIYIRDVLLASNFGRDKSSMTKWYSISEPMDPCLFEKLEEFYRFGKKFSGSQFLSRLAESQESYQNMQAYVQRVFFDPAAREQGNIDTMNRCFIFDVVNETLAKKLVPYVALPRPWMKPLTKPVVRPRPTGSALMQEIWTDIYDQIGNNGSMSMDKTQLHQSLEDLISEDLFRRTDLFPSREVERAAERVGIELERRILDDLLEETINSLWNSVCV